MKTVAVDFDGVIAEYYHFRGKGVFGPPVKGVVEELIKLKRLCWRIIINTTRSETWLVKEYLNKYGIPWDFVNYNPENHTRDLSPSKIIADVYIDDRAIAFDGEWKGMAKRVDSFKPWYRRTQ